MIVKVCNAWKLGTLLHPAAKSGLSRRYLVRIPAMPPQGTEAARPRYPVAGFKTSERDPNGQDPCPIAHPQSCCIRSRRHEKERGNPVHDIIRLGLSLATAARSSDLPGVTTARMIEEMMIGYSSALADGHRKLRPVKEAKAVHRVMEQALKRRWRNLAEERIEDVRPSIPRGDKFWEVTAREERELQTLFATPEVRKLVTAMRSRDDSAKIKVLDAAYWVKGCSSLGRLRYAVLVGIAKKHPARGEICLLDIKEATAPAAPRAQKAVMPRDNAERVVAGARALAPNLGERMLAARLNDRPVVIRELLPQDLKLEIEQLTHTEAVHAARFLATVVGEAHARQMDRATRLAWHSAMQQKHTKTLDAPSWFWSSVVELVASHEAAYLEHCRRYQPAAA